MAQLAATLQSMLGHPVVDRTGLAGAFDIDLRWAASEVVAPYADPPNDVPSIFNAVQEQFGAKAEL